MAENKNIIEPIDASFDDVAASLLGKKKESEEQTDYSQLIEGLNTPQGWSVPLSDVLGQGQVRLDAEHYDPLVIANDEALASLGCELKPLSEFADVVLPSMFTRIWAKDAEHGAPYLNATDLMSYFALGVPAQERFLSFASDVKFDLLTIRTGMILVTCSGTIGRVFDVPEALNGWAGTHDLVRINPKRSEQRGYLRAYLTTPLAQIQILSHTHGGQIDHVTAEQVGSCLVPVLPENAVKKISRLTDEADASRASGLKGYHHAASNLMEALHNA